MQVTKLGTDNFYRLHAFRSSGLGLLVPDISVTHYMLMLNDILVLALVFVCLSDSRITHEVVNELC